MEADILEVISGLKKKGLSVRYIMNNGMTDGVVGLLGTQATLSKLGYDDSSFFQTSKKKELPIEKVEKK
jgi:hypothetical protein